MDALLAQLFQGISPVVLGWYRDRTGIAQKLKHLEMLVIKIRSVLEVSQKVEIKNENLLKLQQKFKDAATQGDEVLHKLQDQQKEDVEKLSSTIKLLEDTSAHVTVFLKTLKFELFELVHQAKKRKRSANNKKKEEKKDCDKKDGDRDEKKSDAKEEEDMAFWPPYPRTDLIDLHKQFPRFIIPVPEDYVLKRAFPEWLQTNTSRVSKRGTALSQLPDNSDTNSEESEKLEEKEEDESLLLGERKKSFKETGQAVSPDLLNESLKEKGVLVSPNLLHLLPRRDAVEVSAVDGLAARIQHAVDQAKQKDEDGSWFGRWSAMFSEAAKEGNSVISAIRSNDFLVHDHISDEVGLIVTHIRRRLESMYYDLEDFSNLAEAEKLVRELTKITPGPSTHADKK